MAGQLDLIGEVQVTVYQSRQNGWTAGLNWRCTSYSVNIVILTFLY
jgi:hypothetical protein